MIRPRYHTINSTVIDQYTNTFLSSQSVMVDPGSHLLLDLENMTVNNSYSLLRCMSFAELCYAIVATVVAAAATLLLLLTMK